MSLHVLYTSRTGPALIIRKPYSPTKSLVPPTILVRVRCRVRVRVKVLESSGRDKRFSGRIIGTR